MGGYGEGRGGGGGTLSHDTSYVVEHATLVHDGEVWALNIWATNGCPGRGMMHNSTDEEGGVEYGEHQIAYKVRNT